MSRRLLVYVLIISFLVGCSALTSQDQPVLPPTPTSPPAAPPPVPTGTSSGGAPITWDAYPAYPLTTDQGDEDFSVRYHPDGPLYVGDQISFEVIAPTEGDFEEQQVLVQFPDGELLGPVDFGYHGIGRRQQATLLWVWDTSSLDPAEYTLTYSLLPSEVEWQETVTLLPSSEAPFPEPDAGWEQVTLDCCQVYYITGTEAERDLGSLLEAIQQQALHASQVMGLDIDERISITLLPRILGHGGFAGDEISISYLDRAYTGSAFATVLHHEMIHELDGRLGGKYRPSFLVEGLAVYLTGGHFKPEPLMPRAAALLPPSQGCVDPSASSVDRNVDAPLCTLDWLIPFDELVENFYFTQHEIGYLQAGALVEYMVSRWGWKSFDDFYRDIDTQAYDQNNIPNGSLPVQEAVERGLLEHFGLTLSELEGEFMSALRSQRVTAQNLDDVRLMVEFFDTARRYQSMLDPSAYFLTAWLTSGDEMRQREIVADYLRRPDTAANIALETMLVEADAALRQSDYIRVEPILAGVNSVLDALEAQSPEPFAAHPLASDYYAIVTRLLSAGYNPQQISLNADAAQVQVKRNEPGLISLTLARTGEGWEILIGAQ